MGIDDMMYPGRPIPAELIERYGPREYIPMPVTRAAEMDTHLARDQVQYRSQIMEDGMQSDIHRSMPGARRYPHDLPRSPYYRSSI